MDVMNISLGLLVLGMFVVVAGAVVTALIHRDPDHPLRKILVREPVRTLNLDRRASEPSAAGREANR
jgi:hypothetical protein